MDYLHNKALIPNARTLRRNMTKEERHLWYDFLRNHPAKVVRQRVFGNYIVDFYCAAANLVIELDGSQHYEPSAAEKDAQRTAYLQEHGLTVIRIPNNEVMQNFRGVCEYLEQFLARNTE